MKTPFPFSAIVGQHEMKQAMILTAVDPGIGGVLVFGDRGTGKSTAVRALAALLPPIRAVESCPVNAPKTSECPEWAELGSKKIVTRPTPVIDLTSDLQGLLQAIPGLNKIALLIVDQPEIIELQAFVLSNAHFAKDL